MKRPHDHSGAHAPLEKETREYRLIFVTPSVRVYRIASDARAQAVYQLEQTQAQLFPGDPSVTFLEEEVPEIVGALISSVASLRRTPAAGAGEGLAPPASAASPFTSSKESTEYFFAVVRQVVEEHVKLERKAISDELVEVPIKILSRAIGLPLDRVQEALDLIEEARAALAAFAARLAEGRR